jgi:hypothetical protein
LKGHEREKMVFAHKKDKSIGKNDPFDLRHGLEEGFWPHEKSCESEKNNEKGSAFCHYGNSYFEHSNTNPRRVIIG